jgi:hypothetical protein
MRKLTCGGGEGISRLEIHPANPSDLHTRAHKKHQNAPNRRRAEGEWSATEGGALGRPPRNL